MNPRIETGENVFYTFVGSHDRGRKPPVRPAPHDHGHGGDSPQKNGQQLRKSTGPVGGVGLATKTKKKPLHPEGALGLGGLIHVVEDGADATAAQSPGRTGEDAADDKPGHNFDSGEILA